VVDSSRREEILYTTSPGLAPPARAESGAAVRTLLDLRFFPELRAQGFQRFFDDPDRPGMPDRPLPGSGRNAQRGFRTRLDGYDGPGEKRGWALVLAPADGSLDAAVARLRRRNLGVGLAVVGLLGATAGLLLLSARQMQRLTRRELELVAGITHELRTPLAAIGSAADNLADGIVGDPNQIRRYGSLIRGETHRLGALVSQVLDFAGTAAMRGRPRPVEPVDVAALVERVLSDHRWSIEQKGFEVEVRSDGDAPRALAEPEALRRALDNVVGNALKYGESGRWLGVEIARLDGPPPRRGRGHADAQYLAVRVRDRGPGIPRAERRRIFEPFYRGAGDAGAHLHGTGLGLAVTRSVLESFGATIELEDAQSGPGATFLITLPAAAAEGGAPA
jgi:signal transduction histidine kinase